MITVHYNKAKFLTSVAALSQLPEDIGAEVAFAGRSNAGKSSALNTITGIGGLAKTSKTPGRTQLLNFFNLEDNFRLVDLPGYGYAKVPLDMKIKWQKTLGEYLRTRKCLKGLVLMMDIRHPLKPFDRQLLEWTVQEELPVHILLTKSDKLSKNAANLTLLKIKEALQNVENFVSVQLFSSFNGDGVEEVKLKITQWLN